VCIAALLLAAPAVAERTQLPGILGEDDRVVLDSAAWPWAAIGRINRGGRGYCTGTLVASNLVLTAAHCLYDRAEDRPIPVRRLTFVSGYRRGEFAASAGVRRIVQPEGGHPRQTSTLDQIARDWAVLVLDRPMATKPVPVRRLEPDMVGPGGRPLSLLTAGYSQDRPHMLSMHAGCAISERRSKDRVLVHSCDATRGASGSPLIAEMPDGLFLIGVITGALENGETERGFAVHAEAFADRLATLATANRSGRR
jgi:protease YdgD